jgi:hypothetical protein
MKENIEIGDITPNILKEGLFTLGKRASCTHWTGGRMDSTSSLDIL